MTSSLSQTGKLDVSQSQKDTFAALTDQSLKPPEFSNLLEASVYNLTKYDEEKKTEVAGNLADQIREAAQIKAEKQAAREEVQVLTMG